MKTKKNLFLKTEKQTTRIKEIITALSLMHANGGLELNKIIRYQGDSIEVDFSASEV